VRQDGGARRTRAGLALARDRGQLSQYETTRWTPKPSNTDRNPPAVGTRRSKRSGPSSTLAPLVTSQSETTRAKSNILRSVRVFVYRQRRARLPYGTRRSSHRFRPIRLGVRNKVRAIAQGGPPRSFGRILGLGCPSVSTLRQGVARLRKAGASSHGRQVIYAPAEPAGMGVYCTHCQPYRPIWLTIRSR
jgi:hypothetical protein